MTEEWVYTHSSTCSSYQLMYLLSNNAFVNTVIKYIMHLLTLWEPGYDIFVPRFRPKVSSFQLPYQRHSSSANCARELYNGWNRSASLLVCARKTIFWLGGCGFFVTDVISEVFLGSFWLMLPGLRAQPLGQSISLKFSLETRLESEYFEPLIDFLAFLVQKLWSKINKSIIM